MSFHSPRTSRRRARGLRVLLPFPLVVVSLGVGLTLLASPVHAQTPRFEWGHPRPQGNAVYDYSFVGTSTGFAVGGGGAVLSTVDGGATWNLRTEVGTFHPDLYGVHALDAFELVAIGDVPGVFHSIDGGASWTPVPNPSTGRLRHLFVGGDGDLFAAGENGEIIKSSDAGANWVSIGPGVGDIRSQWWADDDTGFAVGLEVAHKTTNGGADWAQFTEFDFFGYNEVAFADANLGYAISDFAYVETTDGGNTWTHFDQFVEPLYRFRTLYLSSSHWLTVTNLEGASLWETTDGGDTWTDLQTTLAIGFLALEQAPGGRVLFSSSRGDLHYSDDLGQTAGNSTAYLDGGFPASILSIDARPDGTLFASNLPTIGSQPEAWLRSDDGGRTWEQPAESPGIRWVDAICFATNDVGLAGGGIELARTTDGGDTWTLGSTPDGASVADLVYNSGWTFAGTWSSTGASGVSRSPDMGSTWLPTGGLPATFDVSRLQFLSSTHGFAFGAVSTIRQAYETLDNGATWTQVTPINLTDVSDLYWFDSQTACALRGSSSPALLRTTNRGGSWSVTPASTTLQELIFHTNGVGFALRGWFGIDDPYYTTDAGESWQRLETPAHFRITQAYIDDAQIVLGGEGTRLLRAGVETTTGVDFPDLTPESPAKPVMLSELRVAPSPATRHAWIGFRLAEPATVGMDVFDVSSRRVRSMERVSLPAGDHAFTWNGVDDVGRALPSGTYLVRVRAGSEEHRARVVYVR